MPALEGPAGFSWPEGNPSTLAYSARALTQLAQGTSRIGNEIGRHASVTGWQGPAAVGYGSSTRALGRTLSDSAHPLLDVARRVDHLATMVKQAQEAIVQLAKEADEAQHRAVAARHQAEDAQARVQAELFPSNPLLQPFGAPHEAEAMRAEAAARQAELHADDVHRRNVAKARHLTQGVEDLDRTTARAVDEAAARHPGNALPRGAAYPRTPNVYKLEPELHFSPDEKYLPTDLTYDLEHYMGPDGQLHYRGGELAGRTTAVPMVDFNRHTGQLDYWYYYRNNTDVYHVPLVHLSHDFDNHQGDLEGMSYTIGPNGEPTQIRMSAHGNATSASPSQVPHGDGHYQFDVAVGDHSMHVHRTDEPTHYYRTTVPTPAIHDTTQSGGPTLPAQGNITTTYGVGPLERSDHLTNKVAIPQKQTGKLAHANWGPDDPLNVKWYEPWTWLPPPPFEVM
ncbi:MAG: hypothetical protein J2O39_04515 [Acidimicrobiales bacterium]|nr:hypothetical protein [Acidimicrobiales bacterium]